MNILIPNEIFILISDYLNDKDMLIFVRSCKYIKNLFYKNGFLKNLNFNYSFDPILFSSFFYNHNKTLKSINVSYLNCANYYLCGSYPKNVIFYNCIIDSELNPEHTRTELLKITYKFAGLPLKKYKINWDKFLKLKILYLDINIENLIFLKNIEVCKDLEVICFISENKNLEIPNIIGKLENLKYLITNCNIEKNTKFISKKLEICISKNMNNDYFIFDTKNKVDKNRKNFNNSEILIFENIIRN